MIDRPLIELRNVTKTFGEGTTAFQALRGIDLAVGRGEFLAIMGPSGSGKSTAMNILGCLDTPTGGEYLFEGVHVERLDRNQRALLRRGRFGFIFQGYNLLPRTSALDNTALPLMYRGLAGRARKDAAKAALALVGLTGWETHSPAELSGGQQQRVAIARALVSNPTVLFADEPTGNLDSAMGREVMELLAGLNRTRGLTILMVTHEPDMAAYAHRLVHFRDGRISADGDRRAAA